AITEPAADPADEASLRSDRRARRHREMLAVACAVCLLAFLLHEVSGGRVAVRGLPQFPLPQTCGSRLWLGMRCPGCGLTRSVIHLGELDWQAFWRAHRLGVLFAVLILFQTPYRLYSLNRPRQPIFSSFWLAATGYALIAALVLNWLFDLATGHWTAP